MSAAANVAPNPASARPAPESLPLAAAHAHLAAGRLRLAALDYRAALDAAETPTRVSALLGLSLIARRGNQLPQALRLAQAALELDCHSAVAWACYGSLLHAAGQMQDAQAAYLRSLALPVTEAAQFLPALTGLGDLLLAARRAPAAAACFRRALALRPGSPAALHGFGAALALEEAFEPALRCFLAALEHMPAHAESHFAAGYCAAKLSRYAEAIAHYEQAIRLRPDFAPGWGNLAVCLAADGRDYLAVPCFQQALAANPDLLSALLNFGNLLRQRKRFDEARACYSRALAVDPACTDVQIAMSYLELEGSSAEERFARAEAWLTQAAAGAAEHPEVANAQGILALARHSDSGDAAYLDSALDAFARAAARGHKTADSNAGNALLRVGRIEEAVAAHARSVARDRLHPGARYNLALSQLRAGDFANGWVNYEARLDFRDVHPRPRRFAQPRWCGEAFTAARNRLFVYFEQGLGDTLQFARYLPLVAAGGAQLIVEVQPPLVRLLDPWIRSLGGVCIASGDSIPAFDLHTPLLSLPLRFATTLDSIPPPLRLAVAQVLLDERFPQTARSGQTVTETQPGPRAIGLCWAGNPRYAADRDRSTRLETLLPLLARFPEDRWYSLQKGPASEQIPETLARLSSGSGTRGEHVATGTEFPFREFPKREFPKWESRHALPSASPFPLIDACSADRDLADTAAVVAALDLVLTTDTVIAHLAGSLGKPCWLLLPWQSDWRWMQTILTTPWYPTLRLFRQPAPGNWVGLLERVADELRVEPRRNPGSASPLSLAPQAGQGASVVETA